MQAEPKSATRYVALGSSFAAGLGLGPRAPGSSFVQMRTINGYPQQLARISGLSLNDATCSGATCRQVLQGRRFVQKPQIEALAADSELVTLTIGGNDVGYVGDLMLLSRRRRGVLGFLIRRFWKGPKPAADRNFAGLADSLRAIFAEIRARSPQACIVVVTYPQILPATGTCPALGITEADADLMRAVGARLAATTREVAGDAGAIVVDMDQVSIGHDACAATPWVNGAAPGEGAAFHPTLAGAVATAEAIRTMLAAGG